MPIRWTEEQDAILAHNSNACARVLAGPGTGKSATMVEWIGRILSQEPSPKVRLLTFTRAATAELTKKVAEHEATTTLQPSTVHSFAISVLLKNPGVAEFPEPLRIADDWEKASIVYPTLSRRINVPVRRIDKLFTELAANWEALEERLSDVIDANERARFMAAWQEHRRIFGYTLLSELPWTLRRALQNHPNLEGVDYDLLVVDEYQDLNSCDLEVLKLLGDRGCSIISVGDDDQSIYSFRRAAPEGIRRFLVDYPDATNYPLSITHRCGSRIIEWAGNVIARDMGRDSNKLMPTPLAGSPEGEVALLAFAGQRAEPEGIAEIVDNLINRERIQPSEILILLRSDYNGQFSEPIKRALDARHIEYADPDEVKTELANPANRKLLAFCKLLANRSDSLAWATLIELTPGVGVQFVDWIYDQARQGNLQFGVTLLERLEDGFAEGPNVSSGRARAMVEAVTRWLDEHEAPETRPENGWGRWMLNLADGDLLSNSTDRFAEILVGVDTIAIADEGLGRYLAQVTPLARDQAQAVSNAVRIMTMAASKGLTVEATIIAAAEEGITPILRPGTDVNEECRLLYVAMTRAKRFLFCTWARQRMGPTARAGRARIGQRRNYSSFFEAGPTRSQDGNAYVQRRWPG